LDFQRFDIIRGRPILHPASPDFTPFQTDSMRFLCGSGRSESSPSATAFGHSKIVAKRSLATCWKRPEEGYDCST
jgi:hypothetical protein